ncbi:C2 domain-containing protein [Radiomyces spectabilis]|uniref:C2 domain-containing protein n=1 Tax=Radiomyces spectabilis TaxID=64574 RepID=UPI00221E3E98|nr:C2 domain-containing protein [Radiomyces spectabilis]KAI8391474.1 C2 domain-containing protein [Radiomyces spectabilis]
MDKLYQEEAFAAQEAMDKEIMQTSDTTVHVFDPDIHPEQKRAEAERDIPPNLIPDFRNLGHRKGLQTELGTYDVHEVMQALASAQLKPIKPTDIQVSRTKSRRMSTASPRSPKSPTNGTIPSARIPDHWNIGWTSLSSRPNPGGATHLRANEKNNDPTTEILFLLFRGEGLQDTIMIFVVGIGAWTLATFGFGVATFLFLCLAVGLYLQLDYQRFHRQASDDIHREMVKQSLETNAETVHWLNTFLQKFWLIFEPVMSAYVIENIDTYLVDYLPGFLDSVRLTTFTLGSTPFRVDNVKTFLNTEPDTVCMDWTVSFVPNDTSQMTMKQVEQKMNPKVVLNIRLGKGMVGAGIPVLVEDMSFKGQMRIKLQFTSKFPHIKMVEACFMNKPLFDYVLKPIGGETFGFDVNNIPGLQSFVRDQVHTILGPMMYYPNVFSFNLEKFFAGELDITQANGVLAITVYSCTPLQSGDFSGASISPFVRFYLDKAQELGRTSVLPNTLEPRWNETHFLLLNNLTSILTLELRSQNNNTKDRRIARTHFDLHELSEEASGEASGLELLMTRRGKPICHLKADMRFLPVSKPTYLPDGTVEPAAESNSGVLRLTVHECRHLGGTTVSPYAVVMINGAEKMTTPVFKRNPNPKFERPVEVVVLDKTEIYLRVLIKDSVAFGEDTLLGVWRGYLMDMLQQQAKNDGWWDLYLRERKTGGRIRVSMQWKPVVMKELALGVTGFGLYNPPIGVVRLSLWEARDLRNVEAATGSKSDPYVRVMSGSRICARTEAIDNNLNPEWTEIHYIPVHSMKEDLVLEVMDWNAKTSDKSLGSAVLHMRDIVYQQTKEENGTTHTWYIASPPKIDKWAPLRAVGRKSAKGELHYSAEFYPTMALPKLASEPAATTESSSEPSDAPETVTVTPNHNDIETTAPLYDLNGFPVNYTPDNVIDLRTYDCGVLTVRIHEVRLRRVAKAYAQILVDSLTPQFKTAKVKGRVLPFNEAGDAFVKEAEFSRVVVEIKPSDSDENDDIKLGYWVDTASNIIRHIQQRQRRLIPRTDADRQEDDDDDGDWYPLLGSDGAEIRLSFCYAPLMNFHLSPDESLENQGNLTVTLLSARNLKAVDKSGTSDPYVVFTIDGARVHKSITIKKSLSPVWRNEQFVVPIQSRRCSSFRIEVFDWNQFQGDESLGSGGISLASEFIESFVARDVQIPLAGPPDVTGTVRVRFLWQPQLLAKRKTHTSVLSSTTRMLTGVMGLTSSHTTSVFDLPPTISPARSISNRAGANASAHSRTPSLAVTDTSLRSQEHEITASETGNAGGVVKVTLMEARGLRGVDKSGTSDPYVRVTVDQQPVFKSKVIKKSLTPVWNESFNYTVARKPTIIDFKIKDYNRFSHSVDLGECRWNIWELLPSGSATTVDKWLRLYPSDSGEIHVKIEFSPH